MYTDVSTGSCCLNVKGEIFKFMKKRGILSFPTKVECSATSGLATRFKRPSRLRQQHLVEQKNHLTEPSGFGKQGIRQNGEYHGGA